MLRFAVNLVLARLVSPEVFGVMALVNLIVQGVHMVSDVGIGSWVMRHPRGDDPRLLNTAWTVGIVRGGVIWVAAAAIAGLVAWLYGEPQLFSLIAVAGSTAVLYGLYSAAMLTQARRMAQGRLMMIQLVSYGTSAAFSVGWVWVWPTPWGLVAGTISSGLITLALSHLVLPRMQHRFVWDRAVVADLFVYGRWVFVSTFLTYLTNQADRLTVGLIASVAALGVYHMAAMFVGVPVYLAAGLCGNWVLPVFSRLRDQPGARRTLTAYYALAVRFGWGLTAGVLVTAPAAIELLYRGDYLGGVGLVRLLVWGAWFQILFGLQSSVLFAYGSPRTSAIANGVKLIALPGLATAGAHFASVPGMVVGFALADAVRYVFTLNYFRRECPSSVLEDCRLTLLLAVVTVAEAVAADQFGSSTSASIGRLAGGAAIVSVVAGGLLFKAWHSTKEQR
ncbi:Polysaccharide biosynthesis protein [Fimbriiglobus ruber]|uniref:Polysaccharide biosynthesis protein n=1 Tax=Fimbriiglobus ruber TaxID=1908690 RepID=A0A225CZQ5_9BACT|nr:Polysaccharide biosynthesis protein [Fimbriiglobus ruber]